MKHDDEEREDWWDFCGYTLSHPNEFSLIWDGCDHKLYRCVALRQIVFDDGVVGIMPTMWFL